MIAEYIFPFGASNLQLKFSKEIDDKYLNNISILIEGFENELNRNMQNSSAYIFNNAQIGMPAFVQEEFIDFVHQNIIDLSVSKEFKPFIAEKEIKDINDFIVIDKDSSALLKKQPVTMNCNILSKAYILDKVNEYLHENNLLNYLITNINFQSSFGKLRWNTNFPGEKEPIHFKMLNQNAIVENIDESKIKKRPQKFATQDKPVNASKIIMMGEISVCHLKVLSYLLHDLYFESDFRKFKKDNHVELILIDEKDNIIQL